MCEPNVPCGKTPSKRDFHSRQSYLKKEPTLCSWWNLYVKDNGGYFSNPNHRDGKLFLRRFQLPYVLVKEVWTDMGRGRKQSDAFGRKSAPIELLVLGLPFVFFHFIRRVFACAYS